MTMETCSSNRATLAPGRNPFATCHVRPGAMPFLFDEGQSAATLIDELRRGEWRGQIIGPHGTGKSTLLATLIPALEQAGRSPNLVVLRDGQRRLPPETLVKLGKHAPLLIVDGYEQLSWISRWRLKRRCRRLGCGLIVTAHRDVGLTTIYRTSGDSHTARRVVEQLLSGNESSPLDATELADAWRRHRGNLREMLFDLYDVYERRRPRG